MLLLSALVALMSGTAVLASSPQSPSWDTPTAGHYGAKSWLPNFQNLVAFGDSYTDESRLAYFFTHNDTGPPAGTLTPFSNGTAGGGLTWDRWVSEYSGAMLYDYAVSGAVCDNNMIERYLTGFNAPFPDVVYEVNSFVADINSINATTKTNTLYPNRTPDNTVYSMWIGTNDLGNSAFITDSPLNGATIPNYVDCIFNRFDTLYKNGARYFVLMNTAPLQLSPLYGMPDAGGVTTSQYWPKKPSNITEISSKMKEYTQLVNNIYAYRTPYEVLIAKRYPGASIAVMDMNALMSEIYYNPTAYLTSPVVVDTPYHLCPPSGINCTNANMTLDHYFWYDDLHPSQGVDMAIAKEFVNVVNGTSMYATYW